MKLRLIVIGLFALLAKTAFSTEMIYKETSQYQNIMVTQSGSVRCMVFNNRKAVFDHMQTCMDLSAPNNLLLSYSKLILSSLLVKRKPERVLVIGMGGGVLPRLFSNILPDAYVESVEIDPSVAKIAQKYFFFTPDDYNRIYIGDGRQFVREALKRGIKYDLVIIDAFNGEYIPEHLMTADFLKEVKRLLNPDGVVASNTFSRSKLYDHESATYQSVFGDFYNLKEKKGNRVIIATATGKPSISAIQENAKYYAAMFEKVYGVSVNYLLPLMSDIKDWKYDTRIMTDQYSPANLLQDRKDNSISDKVFFNVSDFVKVNPLLALIIFLVVIFALFGISLRVINYFDKKEGKEK